ncbi:hypothetical protein FB567DRAFT_565194 [Paraphoma chrysanthemicola]|uniref:Protein OS-9 homolog n=1 Tax=Paraphoma chrysanthemicola TaxID=798071 RepID=A0A8K0VR98_9PLEO|nr:hypothetical protein FB567DRAFT_565194 [Paraphoma chrysanthemicola]
MFEESSQPTQPATQQVLDPRRLGRNNSGLNDGDIADVLAILHPATPTAIRIVENAAELRPQHVLFRNSMDSMSGSLSDIEEQETIIINGNGERVGHSSRAGADLALRMTSAQTLRFKELGFIFGRNANSADIVFGQDSGKRISNQHFRIYLSADGILMLEDMSTNGTIVDDVLLKCKDKRFNKIRMLGSGSIICIQNANDDEMIKFVVRVPSRVSYMERFRENLRNFIAECSPGDDKKAVVQRISKQYIGPSMKWDGGSQYNIIGMLGKGAFATVHQLATKMDGRLLAAKELEKRRFMKNGQLDKKIDNEMKIMQSLRHPNIVEFVEYHDQGDYLYIIMEFVRHGDVQAYLTQGGPMKETVVRSMAQQILSALNYLHRMKITHRDIKPDNILISEVEPFTVKLSDFGLSKVVKTEETFLKTFCGTLLYCAPEVFPDFGHNKGGTKRRRGAKTYHAYSSSVDIWSFAGVLWYALCGEPPFKGIADATGEAMYNNIMATPLDPTPLRTIGISEPCIDLLTRMLQTDPALRPTDRDCLNHPWLKQGIVLPADPTLQSIVEEDESEDAEQQLSQLQIGAEIPESDEEEDIFSDDEMMAMMAPKRVRPDPLYPRNQIRGHDSSASPSLGFRIMPAAARPRLFGEIGQSALQSSGILSARANSALPQEESVRRTAGGTSPASGHAVGGAEPNVSRVVAQLDGGLSSPSLLGAESMVRDLNMESPHSPVSRAQSPFMPATPRQSQVSEPTPRARPAGPDRQISLPLTASYYYDPADPSTHNLEYASRRNAEAGAPAYEDTRRESDTSGHSEFSTTAGAVPSPLAAELSVPAAEPDFKPPLRRLGKLIATTDSINRTSWGRHGKNTVIYENTRDIRIPKTAFATVEEMSQQGEDWMSLPDLKAGICTFASNGIMVNGKHLRMKDEKGRALYGHHPQATEGLKFKCEFYLGACKEPRPPGESFTTIGIAITMRNFWALPAVLRIAVASQHAFSVFDDLLAFPQYEVNWPDTFITENDATSLLSQHAAPSSSSAMPGSQETQELSKRDKSAQAPAGEDALEHTYEAVVLEGQRYLCSIPVIPDDVPQNSTTTAEEAKAEEEKELVRATDRGWELLEGMKGSCIYYLSGWWSYSFCYKNEVKQFHQLPPSRGVPIYPPVEDTSVHSFVLGRYPKEDKAKKPERKTLGSEQGSTGTLDDEGNVKDDVEKGLEVPRLESKGSSRYMAQRLSGGTQCDLTGKPRKIDVQFHCNQQSADRIAMIKETSTCSYLMIVDTPRLCHDVAFLPPQENLAHPITCQPVIPDSLVDDWTAAKIEAKLKEAERVIAEHDDANSNPLREVIEGLEGSTKRGPIIGGIEVGAHALVGSEGKVIEKSVVAGGGKETYVGTVASSDGKQMTKEEMKKLNIADPKDVEKVKNNLKRLAGRKGWKLDLVDTPRGREFRGIIEAEDQDAPKKDAKKEDKGSSGMRNNKEPVAKKEDTADEEEVQEGSEEVYKDEL